MVPVTCLLKPDKHVEFKQGVKFVNFTSRPPVRHCILHVAFKVVE